MARPISNTEPPRVAIDPAGAAGGRGSALKHQVPRFLVVGILSYAVDVSVLYLGHGRAHITLWLATSLAYLAGLIANFGLNRMFTFRSSSRVHVQLARYAALLVGNYLVTVGLVTGLTAAGCPYLGSKTICVALLAVVNFFAYRHWVFSDRGFADGVE